MSFKAATMPLAKFVLNYARNNKRYDALKAILDASRVNTSISAVDTGLDAAVVGPGKKRKLRINYYPAVCDVVGDCTDSVCTGGTVIEPMQADFDLKRCISSKVFQIRMEDVRTVDGNLDFTDHAQQQIRAMFGGMSKALALQVLTLLYAAKGVMPNGAASRRVSVANTASGAVSVAGKWEIERTFADSGYNAPFIIGGTEVDIWKRNTASNAAGIANNPNTATLGDTNMYYDPLLNQVVGDGNEHILAFDPTVFKFVSWNRNRGIFATDIDSIDKAQLAVKQGQDGKYRGILIDPIYGLAWDLEMYWSTCGEFLNYRFKLEWDLWFMPDADCNPAGVNGIFHFTTCPVVMAPCPTGDAPPAPVVAGVYDFTPTSANYGYIDTVTVAGQTTTVGANVANITELTAALNANAAGYVFRVNDTVIEYTGYGAQTVLTNGGAAAGGKDLAFAL